MYHKQKVEAATNCIVTLCISLGYNYRSEIEFNSRNVHFK